MTEKSSVFNLSFFRHKTLIHIMDVISTWFDYVVLLYRMHFRFENFSARIACGFFVRWVFHLIAFPNHLSVLLKNPFENRNDFEWVRLHVDHTTKILHVFECFFFLSRCTFGVCVGTFGKNTQFFSPIAKGIFTMFDAEESHSHICIASAGLSLLIDFQSCIVQTSNQIAERQTMATERKIGNTLEELK